MAKPLTVSELSKYISNVMKRDPILSNVYLEGEVSNFKKSNGHVYFSLKDKEAMIRCIIFRNMDLSKECSIYDGLNIIIKGSIITYAGGSYYQVLVKKIELSGEGDIYKQYEILKNKLFEEGLFREEHKKPLPKFPQSIGVVTSSTGAAVRDIITTLKRRYPICNIVLYPAIVQGENAAADIIRGLEFLDRREDIDLIIFGRGGGSFEDLNAFNNENLLRIVYQMKTPTISAVGHEIDNMLSDYVADVRAATPTAAAEIASPNIKDILSKFEAASNRMNQRIKTLFKGEFRNLDYYAKEIEFYNPLMRVKDCERELAEKKADLEKSLHQLLKFQKQNLEYKKELLTRNFPLDRIELENEKIEERKDRLNDLLLNCLKWEGLSLDNKLEKMTLINPKNILNKGYARVYKKNELVQSSLEVNANDRIKILMADGILYSQIEKKETFNG